MTCVPKRSLGTRINGDDLCYFFAVSVLAGFLCDAANISLSEAATYSICSLVSSANIGSDRQRLVTSSAMVPSRCTVCHGRATTGPAPTREAYSAQVRIAVAGVAPSLSSLPVAGSM